MKLTGNTILITGGTSGIGRGLAESLHKLGNHVIIAGRRKDLLKEITDTNPGIDAITLDISDSTDIQHAALEVQEKFPKLNVLINNAGIMPFDDVSGPVDEAQVRNLIDTNLIGPILLTGALIEHLKQQPNATVVNNSSALAYIPLATTAVYSATKAAIHSYSLSLRFMLRNSSVKVQEISPPWVNTDLIKKTDDPRAMDLDEFLKETIEILGTDAYEVIVERAFPLRENAGPNEHEFVHAFNESLISDPIPV